MRHLPSIFVLLTVLLSGCADPTPTAPGGASSGAPTKDLGSIEVRALTDELEPVADVLVIVLGLQLNQTTDARGLAVINDVMPGEHTLVASRPGYRTVQEKGILVRVVAAETTQAKFVVNPIQVITAESSFHRVTPIKGFVACSAHLGVSGNLDQCGKGVFLNGQNYGADPNDNTVHTYPVEASEIQQIFAEVAWRPTNEALASKMRVWNYPSRQPCSGAASTGYCYNAPFGGAGGASPLLWNVLEGSDENITRSLMAEEKTLGKATPFPRTFGLFVEPVTNPIQGNVGYSFTYQQGYDVYVSVFYGEAAPEGYSALPPS